MAILSPYIQLSRRARPAESSVLLSPPTNALSGLRSAIRQRHLFLAIVALTALLAELCLPVTLSHVPPSRFYTTSTRITCVYTSIVILVLVLLVIVASFLVKWPHMPVDPRTIAGAMFYICDSRMLSMFEGMACLGKKERDLEIRYMRSSIEYGLIRGVSGRERMGVEVYEDRGEAARMVPDKGLPERHSYR